ncbi:hypothetical protein B0T16DRAFT_409926 [Cercophora newfieldiana]|uniref:Uncharacterized protein n=1 Tax=Cercophora newfieldiana TaxID=92897 RepID=A0AA39YE73_9PEZI|nr:hypothetical protein B0T16DRAFT_409926 [Cercophora newfieldiana]
MQVGLFSKEADWRSNKHPGLLSPRFAAKIPDQRGMLGYLVFRQARKPPTANPERQVPPSLGRRLARWPNSPTIWKID